MTQYVLQVETVSSHPLLRVMSGRTMVPFHAENDEQAIAHAKTEASRIMQKKTVKRWWLEQTRVLIEEEPK